MKKDLLVIFLGAWFFMAFKINAQHFENVQLDAEIKKANNGKMQVLKMTTYYGAAGKMVTFYSKPDNLVIINNEKGNVSIYDENNNTVIQSDNQYYSSKTNELYYFLSNKKDDLGLSEMGFTMENTVFEDGFIVSHWAPPAQAATYFSAIKLVHKNYNPIYVEYLDADQKIVKKVYFAKYQTYQDIDLPTSITNIDFKTQEDSIVSQTRYANIIFDTSDTAKKLEYDIPSNAQLIK